MNLTSPDAYAIRIEDDINMPVIRPGDVLYVEPRRRVMVGRSCCIRFREGTEVVTRFMGYGEGGSVLAESWAGKATCYKVDAIEALDPVLFHRSGCLRIGARARPSVR